MNRTEAIRSLFVKTIANWTEDNVPRLAAAFSFYAILSVAPVLVLAVSVASMFLARENVEQELLRQVRQFVGNRETAEFVRTLIQQTQTGSSGPIATVLSVVVTFFGASNLFLQLDDSINTIWGIRQTGSLVRVLILSRLYAFVTVIAFGAVLLSWLALDSWLSWIARRTDGFPAWTVVSLIVGCLFFTGATGIAFKNMPKGKVAWSDVWPGAAASGIGIALSKWVFAIYFGMAGVSSAYGAAGALVVLLLWIYYSAQIFFFGLEMTYTYAFEFGSHRGKDPEGLARS